MPDDFRSTEDMGLGDEFNPEDYQPGPLPDVQPPGGGTIQGSGPDSGALQGGPAPSPSPSPSASPTPSQISQGDFTGSATPNSFGTGYTFIAPGVTYGNMTPGGARMPEAGYSYYNRGDRSWRPVSAPPRQAPSTDVGLRTQPAARPAAPAARPARPTSPLTELQ